MQAVIVPRRRQSLGISYRWFCALPAYPHALRIIGGAWRGRALAAPTGQATRPTAQRMRQAMFDMLMHAPWGGRALVEGASVLDGFAGTGALGLEALSRGASKAFFLDRDRQATAVIAANVAACKAQDTCRIILADIARPPKGDGQALVFLDPPYGQGLLPVAIAALRETGWVIPGTVVISESGRLEQDMEFGVKLAQRVHGAAQVNVWREV